MMLRLSIPLVLLLPLALVATGCNTETQQNGGEAAADDGSQTASDEATTEVALVVAAPSRAVAVMEPVGDSGVSGTIYFMLEGDTVHVEGEVTGLTPGKHAIHVHQYGDISNMESGTSAGGHFNPTGQPHGRPSDEERHVGDLGNIEADESGTALIDIEDTVIQLDGPHSIIGRSLVIHQGEDMFTQPTGDAGARSAVAVIGIAQPQGD